MSQKQIETIKHIRNWLVHYGRTPSIRELMISLEYKSPRSVQILLNQLKDRGVIRKHKSGNYQLIMNPDLGPFHAQTVDVPLVGTVSCGVPVLAEENIESYVPVSISLAKPGLKYFLLKVTGDSMDEVGINDGDLVLARQQSVASNNDRVVALIDDEAVIKEYHQNENTIILKPRSKNKSHKPIILTEDFQIQGVVVATISNFK